MTRLFAVLALACAAALSGCGLPTYFSNPIAPSGGAAPDERLIGEWAAQDSDVIYRLVIRPSDAEGEAGLLAITATAISLTPGPDGMVEIGWYNRVAYPSVIDGVTYYNVRATEAGNTFVALDSSGPRVAPKDDDELFVDPPFAAREFWLVRAEISETGQLLLRFAVILPEGEDLSPGIREYVATNGLAGRFSKESCGKYCDLWHADLPSETVAELVRRFPDELFLLSAGPFARLQDALPEFRYGD